MKKIFLFLLLIPVLCFGQYPNYNKNGVQFNYVLLPSETPPAEKWLPMIFWQGSGEWGPLDGSSISRCWSHEYPKLAKLNMYKFPFDILVLQGTPSNTTQKIQDWRMCELGLWNLMDALGWDKAIMAGLSQGGQQSLKYAYKKMNPSGRIIALAVAGAVQPWGSGYEWLTSTQRASADYSTIKEQVVDIPIIAVHGDSDTSGNSWYGIRNYLADLNSIPGRVNKAQLITILGGNHDSSWTQGFNPINEKYGKLVYEFIQRVGKPEPPKDIPGMLIRRGSQVIGKFEDGQEVIIK